MANMSLAAGGDKGSDNQATIYIFNCIDTIKKKDLDSTPGTHTLHS